MKRIVSILMALVIIFSCVGCSNTKEIQNNIDNNEEYITRASWVETVGDLFGMTEYLNEKPYFVDVSADSNLFKYVQSCYEWNVISTDTENFNPESTATLGFAVCSSVMIIKGGEEGLTNDDLLDYAVKAELISEEERAKSLNTGITAQRASDLVIATEVIYLSENTEVIDELVVSEDLKDYSNETENIVYVDENEYKVDDSIGKELGIGDIITVPGNDGINAEVAVKVSEKKENPDGTYTLVTKQPEMEEVFEEINIQGTRYADYDYFVPVEGVTVSPLSEDTQTSLLDNANGTLCVNTENPYDSAVKLAGKDEKDKSSFELTVKLNSKGKIELAESYSNGSNSFGIGIDSDGSVSIDSTNSDNLKSNMEFSVANSPDEFLKELNKELDFDFGGIVDDEATSLVKDYESGILKEDELERALRRADARMAFAPRGNFKKGWSITGKVAIKDFAITPDVQFGTLFGKTNIFDFKKATVRVTGTIESSLKVKGNLSGEYKVGELIFPTTIPTLTINVQFFVYFEANGELSIKTSIKVDNKIECKKGAAPKKTNNTTVENEVEAKLELEVGAAAGAAIYVLGFDVLSVRIKAGAGLEIGASCVESCNVERTDNSLVYTETYKIKGEGGIYFPLITLEVNETKGNVLGKLGLKLSAEIISKDSIKNGKTIGKYIPFFGEDGYEKVIFERKITIEILDEEETEYEGGDYLLLNKLAVNLEKGSTETLVIENYPEGYDESDIKWTSDNKDVVTVKDGKLVAVGVGSANVTATTNNGNYSCICGVIVYE